MNELSYLRYIEKFLTGSKKPVFYWGGEMKENRLAHLQPAVHPQGNHKANQV
jgi:hypothetical protein